MTPTGMMAFGVWCLFMGLSGLLARWLLPEPGRRGKAIEEALLRTLRRFRMAASDEYYEAVARIMIPGLLVVGAVFLAIGIVRR